MALKTRLTDMLNVQHPIMLAGMGGVSYAEVCAAMCNAGGYRSVQLREGRGNRPTGLPGNRSGCPNFRPFPGALGEGA